MICDAVGNSTALRLGRMDCNDLQFTDRVMKVKEICGNEG